MEFSRNNLDRAASPYLRQHADNPVWWQEWTPEVLEYARSSGRVLLVSVGYSTCHWCHVMAAEAFSDGLIAEILNRSFVAIKVDREQRPDIDHYLMSFLVATTGSGGWPLNAFLTADGRPFYAMTYASTEPRFHVPAFQDVLEQVLQFNRERGSGIRPFELATAASVAHGESIARLGGGVPSGETSGADTTTPSPESEDPADRGEAGLESVLRSVVDALDPVSAGFGTSQKFPPHAQMLFLEYVVAAGLDRDGRADGAATRTLDAMMNGGLHDHLQGGFYRYCVDRDWTIPHFEKMLYDQGLLLWGYSITAGLHERQGRPAGDEDRTRIAGYRQTAAGIVRCLEESFRLGEFYAAAHDADTNHREGRTYLWTQGEIAALLDDAELDAFVRVYRVTADGNFEGRNHLARMLPLGYEHGDRRRPLPDSALVESAARRLLAARRTRPQPERDEKVIVAWNALAGCGLLAAARFAGVHAARERAVELARALVDTFVTSDGVAHALIGDQLQTDRFLTDAAALQLFLMLVSEDLEEPGEFAGAIALIERSLGDFLRDGVWLESDLADFRAVPAEPFDQPIPSGMALAEYAMLIGGLGPEAHSALRPFADPHAQPFMNLVALASAGHVPIVESERPVPWDRLPVHAFQRRGRRTVTCYRGVCSPGLPPVAPDRSGRS